jgi:hypothetical protein
MSPTDIVTPLLAVLAGLLGTGAPADPAPPSGATARAASADGLTAPMTAEDALRVDDAPAAPGVPTTRRLKTEDGRTVLLRGVNVNALVDYGAARQPVGVTDQDAEQAQALGFTVVRLAVSWSRIMPTPGDPDETYLDEIRTTAKRYTDRGMYVLLDMHQDRYSAAGPADPDVEADGAPAWAVKTDEPPANPPTDSHPYYGTPESRLAAYHFFEGTAVEGRGLQEHYADALVELAKVGEDLGPGLAGIELYNEPVDPWKSQIAPGETFSSGKLWPLYDRLIDRLRGPDGLGQGAGPYEGPIWFEPTATRTQTDADEAATSYTPAAFDDPSDNLVYGPHIYTDIYAPNGPPGPDTYGRLEASFDAAADEANAYGAALAPTELPGAVGGEGGAFDLHRREVLGHLDRLGIGGMVWVWKLPADPAQDYGWGVLAADGAVRSGTDIAADYGRPRVQASGPRILSETWQDGRLTVRIAGAGVVDLWDGAAFGSAPPTAGVAPRLQLDGQDVVPATAQGGASGAVATTATATLQNATSWVGGRRLRVTVPVIPAEQDGSHTLVLGPAAPVDPPPTTTTTVTPPPTTTTATTTTTVQKPPATTTALRPPPTTTRLPTVTTPPTTPVPPPSVSSLKASPRRFRPVVKGGSGGGTLVSMRLSVPARVRVLVQRAESGRRVGARCLEATKRRRTARRCTRYVTVSTTTLSAKAGVKRWRFSGVVRRRPLRAGTYRVAVSPTDADGRRGTTRTASLTVLATRR